MRQQGGGWAAEKRRAATASVLAGATLTVLKLAAGVATSSLGLLAEAAHSALDLGAAGLTWLAVTTSSRPPDADHQYGHGKVENLAALAETLLLVIASFWILVEATRRLLGGGPDVEPTAWAFVVMLLSMVVDYYRARDLRRVAEESRSQALEADALHFSTDVASSAVVILGLTGVLIARMTGWRWLELADPVAASLVAVIVLFLSWSLGRRAVDVLMDRAPTGLSLRVAQVLAGVEGIEGRPRVRLREGGDRVFVDVELGLRPGMPVAEGSRIASVARSRIKREVGSEASVLVQLAPDSDWTASLRERVATAVAMEAEHAHNITLRRDPDGVHADLHLELPGRLSLAKAHDVADRVEARILSEVSELRRVDIHLELHEEEPGRALPLDPAERNSLEARIEKVAASLVGERAVHDVMLTRAEGGVYLSCHCFLPPDTRLVEAHRLTDRLEWELHQAIPELTRVAVHAEPEGHHD